jgi:undecaprenyl-diphosphatase
MTDSGGHTRSSSRPAARWSTLAAFTETRILAGLVGLATIIWGFLALTGEVVENETSAFDRALLLGLRMPQDLADPIGPRWLEESGRDITALGGFTALTLITVLGTALLIMHGRRLQALVFAAAVVLAQIAAEVVKHFIDRPRPDLVPHHDLIYSASFPSGHAVMAPVVYFTLAAILAAGSERRAVKTVLMVTAFALVLSIGVSRVYLGVHWPTDVLAGWAMGSAIALVATMVLHALARSSPTETVLPDTEGAD